MAFDVVGREAEVETEALEEHHRDIDALVAGGDDVVAQPVEVGRVELREVELRLAVLCRSWPGARPRLRRHAQVEGATGDPRAELFPAPEPDKVVAALLEEPEVAAEVVRLRSLGAIGAGTGAVGEVVVDVRSGQIHRSSVGYVARRDREVAWVHLRDHERAGCGPGPGRRPGRSRSVRGRNGFLLVVGHYSVLLSNLPRQRHGPSRDTTSNATGSLETASSPRIFISMTSLSCRPPFPLATRLWYASSRSANSFGR